MGDLAPAVQVLLDKFEITEPLTRYLRAIDRGDIASPRACYADGATEEHGGIYSGSAQGCVDTIEARRDGRWAMPARRLRADAIATNGVAR